MEQMAAETTLKAEVEDKGVANIKADNPAWAREERFRRVNDSAEDKPGETSGDPKLQGNSPFPLNESQRKSLSSSSGTTNDLTSPPKSTMGVDCADIVLNCLFCRFHNMIPILPDCSQGLTNHCWGSYRHVDHTRESLHNDDDDSCVELDCGLFGNCHDASDCLELAMEVSEICYH
ncbi:myoD family inhibitor domain-containing protein 2 [Gambusia affinis]|uniref:myoD family inhibitor domain-containing protein 2 n=1 Tax=Gambusia affinis TaxID=33528 RepID=UPI001CDC902D|nr:myoD family inhibitor domain-containing protein 2 [Gambusia affinis]